MQKNCFKNKIIFLLNYGSLLLAKREFKRQKFVIFNERPVEFSFVFRKIAEIYPHEILDVGTGKTALPHLMRNCGSCVTAIDNIRDYWPSGMLNRHYYVVDDDITNSKITRKFDMITCVSVLEHIEQFDKAVKNMFCLLKNNGHLILTFPYNENRYLRNVYDLPESSYGKSASYITQAYSRREIDLWIKENNALVIEQEFWQFWNGEYWTEGGQVIPPKRVDCGEKHQLTCVHLRRNDI